MNSPKHRINPPLDFLLDEAAKVVAEELAQDFVDHRRFGFRPDCIAEFLFPEEKVLSTLDLW
jgi:hypothetical protein